MTDALPVLHAYGSGTSNVGLPIILVAVVVLVVAFVVFFIRRRR